jgi:hypothetical protein
MASRMHDDKDKVYTLHLDQKYYSYVLYKSANKEVSIYLPYSEFSDRKNLPKLVTVTVEVNG